MSKIIATIALDKKSAPALTLLAVVLSVVAIPYITWLIAIYSLTQKAPHRANIGLTIAVCVGVLVAHEIVHALAYLSFGARPKFGARLLGRLLPVLTTSAAGTKLGLTQMIIVGLSPCILISATTSLLAAEPLVSSYVIAAFCVNLVGSVGDIYMVARLCRFLGQPNRLVEDTGTAFIVREA